MSNEDVADVLVEVAELIEIQNGNRYRARAFMRSARLIGSIREPVGDLLAFGRLRNQHGIGAGTVERVKAILRSGTFPELERLRAQVPSGLRDLLSLKGIGPKTAKAIWTQLRISTVPELELALLSGKIDVISGMGAKTKEKIVDAIRYSREDLGRILLPEALAIGARLIESLAPLREVVRIEQCGSARRRRATIGDLDILVGSDDGGAVAARFCTLPGVVDVLLRGAGRCSVRIERGIQVDLRVVRPETFGAGMHYFTGSQLHNIRVRMLANVRGLAINEHGVFVRAPGRVGKGGGGASDQRVGWGRTEAEVFASVSMALVTPELRENEGEIERAQKGTLPTLVEESDLQGDLHVRAGPNVEATLNTLAERGRKWAVVVHPALDSDATAASFVHEVSKLERRSGLALAAGAAVAIAPDGSVPPRAKGIVWVVAQIPESDVVPGVDVTERLLTAIESGNIDCLSRPSGRVVLAHKGHRLDWERILKCLSKRNVALECRGHALALDPDGATMRRAIELGVALSLSPASSSPDEVAPILSAVFEARRGWVSRRHVLECTPLPDALAHRLSTTASAPLTVAAVAPPTLLLSGEVAHAFDNATVPAALLQRTRTFFGGAADAELEAAFAHARPKFPPLATAFALSSLADGLGAPSNETSTRPDAAPLEVAPVEVAPVEVAPPEVAPPEVAPPEVAPSEVAPPEVAPPEVAPVEVAPVEVAPPEVAPPEVAPVEVAPPEVAPVEVAPVEVAPPVEELDPDAPRRHRRKRTETGRRSILDGFVDDKSEEGDAEAPASKRVEVSEEPPPPPPPGLERDGPNALSPEEIASALAGKALAPGPRQAVEAFLRGQDDTGVGAALEQIQAQAGTENPLQLAFRLLSVDLDIDPTVPDPSEVEAHDDTDEK